MSAKIVEHEKHRFFSHLGFKNLALWDNSLSMLTLGNGCMGKSLP